MAEQIKTRSSLTVGELALARQRGYVWFGRLLLEGLTPDLLPFVREVPELATAVPDFYDSDIAAAHYQSIFGFNLFPFQSIFLDSTGLVGGREANRIQKFYGKVGFEGEADAEPDHISQLLFCMGVLCKDESQKARQQQAELLGQHVLRWLLPFTCALKQQKRPFYTALADVLLAFIADHAHDLAAELAGQRPFTLPSPPDILANKKNGWKEIAGFLLTPAATGIYLGRDAIGDLARQLKLPRGFGERQQMLVNLLQSAIVYDGFGEVVTALGEITAVYQAHYHECQHQFAQDVALASQWQARAAQTAELLNKLQTLVA
ncbi:MAG: molecular chaperone TorD family protein [Ardenticatenaceae bacterium]|nr:molecular chaperone TorD family protein [Ardenticatenaceae bacterium]